MTESSQVKGRVWLAAGCALIVGVAVGAGGALALGGDEGPDTGATLTLPGTLDGLRPEAEVVQEVAGSDNTAALEAAELRETVREEAAAKLSNAYGGAATSSSSYSDDGLETRIEVFAVAASTPAVWSAQDAESAPELLRLATPMEWVEAAGDAQCLVRTVLTYPEGTDPADIESYAVRCQVAQEDLTVILEPRGSQLPPERGLELVQLAADELGVD